MDSFSPALKGGSSHLPSSHPSLRADPSCEGSSPMASSSAESPAEGNLDVGYRCSSISSGLAGVVSTAGDGGVEQVGVVGKLRESRLALDSGIGGCGQVIGVGDASGVCDCGAVQAVGSAASRGRDRCHSEDLGLRLSRFNGLSWISFSSQQSQQFESKSEDPVSGSSQRGDAEDLDRWVPEEFVVQSSEQPEVIEKVPMVVPSRAWVDVVKTLKRGEQTGTRYPSLAETEQSSYTGQKSKRIHHTD